jgi:hypothetical protein
MNSTRSNPWSQRPPNQQPHQPRPSQPDIDDQSNYDFISDKHNLIIGSIVLLLTLAGLVIAFLTLRQGRKSDQSNSAQTNNGDSQQDVELGRLGICQRPCNNFQPLTC